MAPSSVHRRLDLAITDMPAQEKPRVNGESPAGMQRSAKRGIPQSPGFRAHVGAIRWLHPGSESFRSPHERNQLAGMSPVGFVGFAELLAHEVFLDADAHHHRCKARRQAE